MDPMDPENGIPNIWPLEPGSGFRNPTYPPSWWVSTIPGPQKIRPVLTNAMEPTKIPPKGKKLGGGFKYFLFSPVFGEDSHFD